MAHRDIITIGGSAGAIDALQQLLGGLPKNLEAAVLVVLHTSNHPASVLPQIMQRVSQMPVVHPQDRTRVERGHVYLAPPDYQMVVEDGTIRVLQGARENLHRPAIDPLFRSAAAWYGRRVIGVILTGLLDDGTAGLMVVRKRGGAAIVQDPATAIFQSMPRSALAQVPDAHVCSLDEIPGMLIRLVREEIPPQAPPGSGNGEAAKKETRLVELDMSEIENEHRLGRPSAFACPECGGVLWEMDDEHLLRFRCRVGHAFTAMNLEVEQRRAIETALWSGLRALEENASLYRRMADRAATSGYGKTAENFAGRAANTTTNAHVLRQFLLDLNEPQQEEFEEGEEPETSRSA